METIIVHNPFASFKTPGIPTGTIIDENYMLVQVGPNVCCVVNLHGGNRLAEPIEVKDNQRVTLSELRRMLGTFADANLERCMMTKVY